MYVFRESTVIAQGTVSVHGNWLGSVIAEAHPMPTRLEGATQQLLERMAPRSPWAQRAAFANLWLTRLLALRKLEGSPTTNAMVRAGVSAAGT